MKKKLLELQKILIDRFPDNASKPELIDNVFVSKLVTNYPNLNQYIEIYYYNLLGKYEICKYINESEILSACAKESFDPLVSQGFIVNVYGIMLVEKPKIEVPAIKEEIKIEETNIKE